MPTPDESSQPDGASKRSLGQRYKDRQRKEGRGRQGEKHKARGKQQASKRRAQSQAEKCTEASGAICSLTPCHPTSLHWVRSTKDRPRRPFPTPSQPITSQGLEHSAASPSPSSPNPQPRLQTTPTELCTHTHTHIHTWSLKLREPDVNTGVRCRVHAHTYTNLCLTDFQRVS